MSRYARTDAYPKTPGRKNKIDDFFAKYEVEIVWNTKDKVCTGCKKLFKTPDNLKKFCTRKCKGSTSRPVPKKKISQEHPERRAC